MSGAHLKIVEEVYMDVVCNDLDMASPEEKSIHRLRRKSLLPAAEKQLQLTLS